MTKTKFKLPLSVKIGITLFIIGLLFSMISSIYTDVTGFYNKSINSGLEYQALERNQITTWDNNYLAFKEKFNIANINKDVFLTTTSIIMQARTDGPNLAWKWNQENQQIPYSEFTSFYRDLSSFVAERFVENKGIEEKKQTIVKSQNALLSTFPGILYNYFLKLPLLEYQYGFMSTDSKKLFKK